MDHSKLDRFCFYMKGGREETVNYYDLSDDGWLSTNYILTVEVGSRFQLSSPCRARRYGMPSDKMPTKAGHLAFGFSLYNEQRL
jgi:hypothetical protein